MRRFLPVILLLGGCGRFGFEAGDSAVPDGAVTPVVRITINHGSPGAGSVTGPNGFTCTDVDGTCTLEVVPGASVTLRGLAATDSWFAGWTGSCGGNFDCELAEVTADITIIADFTPTPNRVFVTSTTTDGAFGGMAGADAICAGRATAAGLNGTFIAYLSDGTTAAPSRIVGSRGWVRTDGAPYADAPTAFASGEVYFPVRLDEFGNDLGDVRVFTGTDFGTPTANRCNEWTTNAAGQQGTTNEVKYAFDGLGSSNRACSTQQHLLCVETGRVAQVTTRPDTGRMAFMTSNGFVPGGGRAAADAHCAAEAGVAGLNGNFLAALATTTESIASRFPADALYRRVDGVRLLRKSGMLTSDWLDVPPELDQFGDVVSADFWTGAARLDVKPVAADNCNDWTDGTSLLSAEQHWTTNTDLRTPAKTDSCDSPYPILCLETD